MDTKKPEALRLTDEPVARHALQRDELLQVALDFIGTLTGMHPPPIETALPEVFAPFYAFVDRVQAITAPQQVQADAQDAVTQAVRDYHFALDTRQHGEVAAGKALDAIQQAIGLKWVQGAEASARAAIAAAQRAAAQKDE